MTNGAQTAGAREYGPFDFALGDELRGERATLGKTLLDVQRDLRIKAAYIAAIEDAKPDAFPNPGLIAGYVRSYARYLGLDPDEVFWRFCQESGFTSKAQAASTRAPAGTRGKAAAAGFRPDFPLARRAERRLPQISASGVGSLLILVCLLGGLGYGGWLVLTSIQRVQFAPVEEVPQAVAELEALSPPASAPAAEPTPGDLAAPVAATSLADLYRQQELEVPILVPRDGPIAALNPDKTGLFVPVSVPASASVSGSVPAAQASALVGADAVAEVPAVLVTEAAPADGAPAAPRPPVVVVAERAAWIRVYLANGTVLFESILEKGQSYSPPEGVEQPMIWAGNSGSVYVRVGDSLRGPLGHGTRAAKDIPLDATAIEAKFSEVTDVPEVISQTLGEAQGAPVAVQ